jgi:hypothetical protein
MAGESGGGEGYAIDEEAGRCTSIGAVNVNAREESMAGSSLADGLRGAQGAVVAADACSLLVGVEATTVEEGGWWS